ncbi:MAG: T9SS type A sorting domain-containing protein [Bacteroidetes bacterium]|nr:T9SS type A sorting domain-containing protein [Bacteroidota bacterium]
MKKRILLSAILLSLSLFLSGQAFSQATRIVLFEEATSCNCGPCGASNPILDAWLLANPTNTNAIKYHPNFGADPMYLANTTQNTERVNYCGINAYPTCNADGLLYDCCWPFSASCFNNVLATRTAVSTPLSVTVTDTRVPGDSIRSVIVLNLSSGLPAGTYKLRVMAVENRVHYTSAPGSNGETDFYNVFRWAYPNTTGVDAPTSAGTYTYTYTYKRLSTWVDTSTYTVAFVQNDVNKEVINSGKGHFIATWNNPISSPVPDNYTLSQNYPNPFNPVTKISFGIPKSGYVSLKVFDITGSVIYTLVSGQMNAGRYEYDFSGADLSSGVYYYKLECNGFTETKKMVLIK